MSLDDPLTIALIIAIVLMGGGIVAYALLKQGKKKEQLTENVQASRNLSGLPFKIVKTIPKEDATQAKEELRILNLEREILSDALRRLYEAQAEGKITEEERERIAESYKSRMMGIKEAISKDESVVALHELESMQEDLLKLFSEKFGELSAKTEELRSKIDVQPIKEITLAPAEAPTKEIEEKIIEDEEKTKKKRRPPQAKPSPKTEAERRIEEIRSEVEKVLDRLGQMESET
ncbi:hypothetical protein KEJ15_03360 [Candidatus Bathyarchaeota archaeon]|nr:hypothetical protein [Candidatus Bathyarchaeota archaeon]